MKAIILAAGCGRRLRPYTRDRPKCLLPFAGTSLLRRQVDTLRACGIDDVSIVKGYLADLIVEPDLRSYVNADYDQSDLVASLRCATPELTGDVIVCYGDIIYEPWLIERLISGPCGDVRVLVDGDWREYYEARLGAAAGRTQRGVVVDAAGQLVAMDGAAARSGDIEAQYIGLTRFGPRGCLALLRLFDDSDGDRCGGDETDAVLCGRSSRHARMRDVLTALIARRVPVHAAIVERGWLEFDTVDDYEEALAWQKAGTLQQFIRL